MPQRLIFALLLSVVIPLPAWAVSVASYASRDDVTVGESFSVNVVVVNTRATAITDFRVSVQRPAETGNVINLADAVCAPTNCSAGAQIHWTQATLAPGEVFTATFKTTLSTRANTAGTVVTFPIAISGGGVSISNSSLQVKSAGPNATSTSQRLRLSSSTPILAPGEEAVITATFGNTHATNISFGNTLTVTVPEGLELVEAIGGTIDAQQATWAIGVINPQINLHRNLIVRSSASDPIAVSLAATLQSSEQSSSASTAIALQPAPTLRVYVDPERSWAWNGGSMPVDLRIENHGSTPLNQVNLRVRIPAGSSGTQYPSDSPTSCAGSCSALSEIVWNVGTLAPGTSRIYTYRDAVHSTNAGHAAVGDTLRLETLATSTAGRTLASADVAIGTGGRLEVQVNPETPSFPVAEDVNVELVVGNWSTTTVALGTTLELRIPPGFHLVNADSGTFTSANVLAWPLGAINPGESRKRNIILRALASSMTQDPSRAWDRVFRNGFEAGQHPTAPGPLLALATSGSSFATHAIRQTGLATAQANPLQLSVIANPGSLSPSGVFTAKFVVSNTDSVDLFGTTVHLRMPWGNYWAGRLTDGGTGGGYTSAGQLLSWDIGQLPAGATRSGTLTMEMRSQANPGLVQPFRAFARANNGMARAEAGDLVTIRASDPLRLTVETDKSSVEVGDRLTYTLSAGNTSTTTTSASSLKMAVPDGATFVSATHGGTLSANRVIWPIANLPPRHNHQRKAVFTIGTRPEGEQLKASVLLEDALNNLAHLDVVNHVETAPALKIAITPTASSVVPNGTPHAEVTVSNDGAVDLFGTTVRFRVPAGNYWFGHASDSGTGSGYTSGGEFITWNIGQLPAGATRTTSLSTNVRSNILPGSLLTYDAWARASNDVDRAEATRTFLVRDALPLRLSIETSRDAVQSGDQLTYTLNYGNTSTVTSTAAVLTLPVPDGAGFVSATDGGVFANGSVTWSLGSIPARQNGIRQATFAIQNRPEGHILSTTATLADSSNNLMLTDAINAVETAAALRLSVAMTPNPVSPNGQFSGSVTITNTDTVDLFGTYVHLRIPAGTYWVGNLSDGGTGGGYISGGEVLTWNLGALAAGQSRTVTLSLQLRSDATPGNVLPYQAWARASSGMDHARSTRVVRVNP